MLALRRQQELDDRQCQQQHQQQQQQRDAPRNLGKCVGHSDKIKLQYVHTGEKSCYDDDCWSSPRKMQILIFEGSRYEDKKIFSCVFARSFFLMELSVCCGVHWVNVRRSVFDSSWFLSIE